MGLPATREEFIAAIREAFSTRSLHGCRSGMSSAEVIAQLGTPGSSERKRKDKLQLAYGSTLLIGFTNDRMDSMSHDLRPSIPRALIEPLLASVVHQERPPVCGAALVQVGGIKLEIVSDHVAAIHLSPTPKVSP